MLLVKMYSYHQCIKDYKVEICKEGLFTVDPGNFHFRVKRQSPLLILRGKGRSTVNVERINSQLVLSQERLSPLLTGGNGRPLRHSEIVEIICRLSVLFHVFWRGGGKHTFVHEKATHTLYVPVHQKQ